MTFAPRFMGGTTGTATCSKKCVETRHVIIAGTGSTKLPWISNPLVSLRTNFSSGLETIGSILRIPGGLAQGWHRLSTTGERAVEFKKVIHRQDPDRV